MRGITKRPNTYKFTVSLGFDGDGNHIRKYTTFKPPIGATDKQADKLAQQAYFKFEQKCKGMKNLRENIKFCDLVDTYFAEYAANELKPVTTYNYNIAINTHIMPVFGNKKIKDIDISDITAFLTKSGFNSSTSRKLKIILSSVFSYGVNQKYISYNPCKRALYVKDNVHIEEKIKCYNVNQAKKLLDIVKDYSVFNTIIKVLLFTGMHVGECLALDYGALDFENRFIRIQKTLTYADKEWFLTKPKTKNSYRTIPMNDFIYNLLLEHKAKQDIIKTEFGSTWKHPEMVFTSRTGNYYDRSLLNQQFKRLLERNDLPHLKIHGLRHTSASLMIHNGVDVKSVLSQLGHCNISITGDIYIHIFEDYKARIATGLENTLL